MPKPPQSPLHKIADEVRARLRKHRVNLTLGGEPSYVPTEPGGAEWNIAALGPTKLGYARALADALVAEAVPGAAAFLCPGKIYPGEVNPRWAIHILWNRDGTPLVRARKNEGATSRAAMTIFKRELLKTLKLKTRWMQAHEASGKPCDAWVLPLDHDGKHWRSKPWPFSKKNPLTLVGAEGAAGLRLPLGSLSPDAMRRALVAELKEKTLHIFFPPLLQKPFLALLAAVEKNLSAADCGRVRYEGYVPSDEADLWQKLSLTPDPGVLEINLPPCANSREYGEWLGAVEKCATTVGLRSFKQVSEEESLGTGGGNHFLFGGPSLEENPLFKNPQWVTSILRYWQHHPSLSYLFTGVYVGSSSQAPRPDESARSLYDLEMAYRFLETLEPGQDYRYLISETLRHLHIDFTGNTHRSEVSFDKFWNAGWDGGCRGLIEFRAIESLPHAEWMFAVGLLWEALATLLFEKPFTIALVDHGARLHDRYFLPTILWEDFARVLCDLHDAGFAFEDEIYRAIWNWRFPQMLEFENGNARLVVRKACEGWPLLCETPLEGGNTSRFVDTSMERLEFAATEAFAKKHRVFVQGRELTLEKFSKGNIGAGLRYRRSRLHPSLHPGIAPHLPLVVTISDGRKQHVFKLEENRRRFAPGGESDALPSKAEPCKKLNPGLITYDLRLA